MRHSEQIALAYFLYLSAAAWLGPGKSLAARVQLSVLALATAGAVVFAARTGSPRARDWAPLAWILVGYYASGWLFAQPSPAIERWLMRWDARLLGDPTTRFAAWPAWLLVYLDVVYTGCFLLLPIGFAALVNAGASPLADHYWSMVSIAELGSFGALAFVQSRPPWAVERPATLADGSIHRMASHIVRRFTIGVNTFPSGHVAGSLAIAMAVTGAAPVAGAALAVVAVSIAVACVVGRYHYIVDVVAGVVLALVAGTITATLGW